MTSRGVKGPGAYYCCGGGEQYDSGNAKYFLKHPNMKWVQTTAPVAANVRGAIPVVSQYGVGYVGRIQVSFSNVTFTQIGKVFNKILYYTGSNLNANTFTRGAFEILVCQP